jgi:hypothetical protein
MKAGFDQRGSASQPRRGSPRLSRRLLVRPYCGLSSQNQRKRRGDGRDERRQVEDGAEEGDAAQPAVQQHGEPDAEDDGER